MKMNKFSTLFDNQESQMLHLLITTTTNMIVIITHLPFPDVRQELKVEWQFFVRDEDEMTCQLQTGVASHSQLGILYKQGMTAVQAAQW